MKIKMTLIIFFAIGIGHFAQRQTDRFTISKIAHSLLGGTNGTVDPLLLTQPYRYLGKGGQSYVFLSQDGRYVLKCFRSSKLQTAKLFSSFFPFFKEKKIGEEKKLEQTLKSYALAFEKLSKETALVAIHIDQTPIPSSLKIIDKLGICHTINPNSIPFVIQKKATLVKEKILQDPFSAKTHLAHLLALLHSRMKKGIEDTDPNLAKNFGFVGDQPIQIDCGRFSLCDHPSIAYIARSKEDFQHWINANIPELSKEWDKMSKELYVEAF